MSCSKTIRQVCDGTLDPCTMTVAQICANWDCLKERDRQLLQTLMSRCATVTIDPPDPVVAASAVVTYTYLDNDTLVVPDGLAQWSVANAGTANGLVDGQILPPNAEIVFTAYFDRVTNEFVRPNGLALDATGTQLLVAQTP